MKAIYASLSALLLMTMFAPQPVMAEDEDKPKWTHRSDIGEDATSHFYYFYRSNGRRIEAVRWVWNGGAQNPPTVVDYLLAGDRIVIRKQVGKRESIPTLIAGGEAALEVTKEYAITCKDSRAMLLPPPPEQHLNDEQRIDLYNLIDLLAEDRKPVAPKP